MGIVNLWRESLPSALYSANDFRSDMRVRPLSEALDYRHIQVNHNKRWRVMAFDIDREDAWKAPEQARLPDPNFITINPANGHAHVGYLLDAPITLYAKSSRKPMRFFDDVSRGFRNRLGADIAYSGLMMKNPLHRDWVTEWRAVRPYDLGRLRDYLDARDITRVPASTGVGRNCRLFDAMRLYAYKVVLKRKREGRSRDAFMQELINTIEPLNREETPGPLDAQELRAIAKSVAEWVWEEFTEARFSAKQRARSHAYWRSRGIENPGVKPWEAEGISRRTWERRRKSSSHPYEVS